MLKQRLAVLVIVAGLAAIAAGCTGGDGTADGASAVKERSFVVKLAPTPLRVGFLTAELSNVSVVERVREGSGEVVEPAQLRGTLKVKNMSEDQTARLVGGTLRYLGADGRTIALAAGREAPTFTFYSYGDRVDPGKETSLGLDVPFPAAAMNGAGLDDLRLELSYIPTPYRTEAATVAATLVVDQ
ncbi:MAG: hypothetical protein HYR51_10020 [Candidatus Rokubacteria bacterium]|nr:hypothetical protein [Candidatus Rokubacteria bacterium]